MTKLNEEILQARILVLDDVAANVDLLQMLLESEGYADVVGLTDSRQAVALLERQPFDLVLLDMRMPHIDGFGVLARIRTLYPDGFLPVLVLTAQNDPETRLHALEAGAKDFLAKPFDHPEALARIHNLLEIRMLYRERARRAEELEAEVARRTAQLRERNRALEQAQFDILSYLARAGEYRDNETGRHLTRMSLYTYRLARAAGMREEDAELLRQASPLHDLGKIGIPDAVLLKAGPLTEAEWAVMRRHPEIGAAILEDKNIPAVAMARVVALAHHERWDGSGYPLGLQGEEIPLEARIVAICDVFDALCSARPYKKAWSVEAAADYLREQAGSQFDPALVGVFGQILDEIVAVREAYKDPGT